MTLEEAKWWEGREAIGMGCPDLSGRPTAFRGRVRFVDMDTGLAWVEIFIDPPGVARSVAVWADDLLVPLVPAGGPRSPSASGPPVMM